VLGEEATTVLPLRNVILDCSSVVSSLSDSIQRMCAVFRFARTDRFVIWVVCDSLVSCRSYIKSEKYHRIFAPVCVVCCLWFSSQVIPFLSEFHAFSVLSTAAHGCHLR
jgi:hypothetical protein